MDRDDWSARLERSGLEQGQVTQIRRRVYEELLWLADDLARRRRDHRAGRVLSPEQAAREALAYLAKAEFSHRPTSAFFAIRARCRQALGEKQAAGADREFAQHTPPAIALDHCLRGQAAFDAKRLAKAVEAFEAALRLEPTHYWSMMQLGYCLMDLGRGPADFAQAVRVYTGCILKRPDHASAYLGRADSYHKLARYDDAMADYSKAIELKPSFADAWSNRGVTYSDLKQYDKALANFAKAIELEPDYWRAWNNRGIIYRHLNQYDKAIANYAKAIELKPDCCEAFNNRGNTYRALKRNDKAIADFTRAIELKPDYATPWGNRAYTYSDLKQYDKAIADYSKAIELKPDDGRYWHLRGWAYANLRQYDKAIADYSKAIELRPDEYWQECWFNRGCTYLALKAYDKAIADLARAIELKPDDQGAWHCRGLAYAHLRQYDKAIADYSKAIELQPDDQEVRYNRGHAYGALKAYDKAIADYSKAVELQPDYQVAWHNRGCDYARLKHYDKAIADYRKALELKPDDALCLSNLAELLANCPDPKFRSAVEAVRLAERSAQLAPTNGHKWYVLGLAQYRAGNWKAAIAALEKAKSIDSFFLAMAHWQLGEKAKARQAYDRAVQWMEKKQPENEDLRAARAEAAELLGLPKK
jgi:tetratricopeptide (TPR) repeat protein